MIEWPVSERGDPHRDAHLPREPPKDGRYADEAPSGPVDVSTQHIGGFCFVAGTLVVMADGTTKPIEQVVVGDQVLSRSDKTGTVAPKRVTHTFNSQADATLVLGFAGGQKIETTRSHPFFVAGRGWVPAGEMGLGTSIVTRAGPSLPVQQITTLSHRSGGRRVYNFTVQDFHTYFVGSSQSHALWVHNAGESGWCNVFANTPDAQKAMIAAQKYDAGKVLPNGLVYGLSVKNLNLNDLSSKTDEQLDAFMQARGFARETGGTASFVTRNNAIDEFPDGRPVPQRTYVHPDGGMVRVKPEGDPNNAAVDRRNAHSSKSVRNPHDGPADDFNAESFKVDNEGVPVPKSPFQVTSAHPEKSLDWEGDVKPIMSRAHTDFTR